MNPPKCDAKDYIQWIIASPKAVSCTEAARTNSNHVAHDAYTRLLGRLEPSPEELWQEVQGLVDRKRGYLVIDDSTLDKPYAKHIELVVRHWSGKHRAVVDGINLITLLWTDGDIAIPVDWRVYDKEGDGLTKNDHLLDMIATAHERGFEPECVLWDSWYSSLKNLKRIREFGWRFFVGIKSNRHVDPDDGQGHRAVRDLGWDQERERVYLKGFGWVQAYRAGVSGEDARYFISAEDLLLNPAQVQQKREEAQQIEGYHRGLKQECHVERCQAQKARKQRNHIALAIRAFVRLEWHRYTTGISRHAAKASIIRNAVRAYLDAPFVTLATSTA